MRYIGNKHKLLNEIDDLLSNKGLKTEGLVFCDIFAGTATVSNRYNGYYKIIANDFLDYSYYIASGLLIYNNTGFINLGFDPFDYFNSADISNYNYGFCYNHFSPNGGRQYFSDENAKLIDFIRDTIDVWFNENKITSNEKSYLICCLLEAVSKVSNVAGVYSAYLKIWDPRAIKKMIIEPIKVVGSKYNNQVFCKNANDLITYIEGDILYIDPPYTPTQYNSQYHVLETIARNDKPLTHGLGAHRENDRLSNWCRKGLVEYDFERLIADSKFNHILFSYSDKGLMSVKYIETVLKRYAKEGTFEFNKINFIKYKNTRAVNREKLMNIEDNNHFEYLFYIEKNNNILYSSPLNYIGGKYEVLPLIKSNLPKNINIFYDLFCGGATVSLNIDANKIVCNDINYFVVRLLNYLSKIDFKELYQLIQKNIKKYSLSKANKEAYYKLRQDYNQFHQDILLYLLLCYGFEHQIRFNSKYEFNNPCGNSGFNDVLLEKLINYKLRCDSINIEFKTKSYIEYFDIIQQDDFVYLDPPYLENLGVYNDGKRGFNGWDKNQQLELMAFIEKLDKRHIKFMLSNYTDHNNNLNNELLTWAKDHNFKIIIDNKITKRNRQDRRELIIINY